MLRMRMTTLYRSSSYLLMIFYLALVSCATGVGPKQAPPPQASTASEWLRLADTAPAPQQAAYRLTAATMFYDQGDMASAEQALGTIAPKYLQGSAVAEYIALRARLMAQREGPRAAADWMMTERPLSALNSLQAQQRVAAYDALAELYQAAGDPLRAVKTRIELAPLLTSDAATAQNQDQLWNALLDLSPEQLRSQRATASNPELQGWLELALVAVDSSGDLERQQAQLAQWQRNWPNHPARLRPPTGIALLQELSDMPVNQIAVLLPMQGRLQNAGNAIRDGIMVAYADIYGRGGQPGKLRFYDTQSTDDVQQLYRQAVADGAELVIGPLAKQKVRRLSALPDLPTPVLALNYLDEAPKASTTGVGAVAHNNFFQFGLSSADDASAAAGRASSLNYRRVLLLHAYDSQSKRTAQAFQKAWQELEGETAVTVAFDNEQDASPAIKNALQLPLSDQRSQKLGSVIGQQLQATPRRRQDIDFVYLPVNAQQARSIKPLLAFHFAQDLPVLASSRVYTGTQDQRSDSDLNGIYFTETPWVLDAPPSLSTRIERHIEGGAANSKNLYALGIDAFRIAPRMALMAQAPSVRQAGLTGSLMVTKQGIIVRTPSWAVFRNGVATPL